MTVFNLRHRQQLTIATATSLDIIALPQTTTGVVVQQSAGQIPSLIL